MVSVLDDAVRRNMERLPTSVIDTNPIVGAVRDTQFIVFGNPSPHHDRYCGLSTTDDPYRGWGPGVRTSQRHQWQAFALSLRDIPLNAGYDARSGIRPSSDL